MVADDSDCCRLEFAERNWVSNDNKSSSLKSPQINNNYWQMWNAY